MENVIPDFITSCQSHLFVVKILAVTSGTTSALQADLFGFLTVTGNNLVGNTAFSQFTNSNVNSTATVTFDLSNFNIMSETVFGIWNISDEGLGQPHYRNELIDSNNMSHLPTTFNLNGNQDNETQVAGRRRLDLDTLTGILTTTSVINAGGVHSDAAFWNNIPVGTQKLFVYGNLPSLATGKGVGYYFATPPVFRSPPAVWF